jgi:hypothetical protein
MKIKKSIIGLCILILISNTTIAIEGINGTANKINKEYTYTTEKECYGGKCNLIIYSGVRFGYEDNIWKNLEELKSWKETTPITCLINYDGENKANCLDYNATSLTIELSQDEKSLNLGKDTPIKIWKKEENITNGKEEKVLKTTGKTKLLTKEDKRIITIPFGLDYEFEFGSNSTTVTLNTTSNDGQVYSSRTSSSWNIVHNDTTGTGTSTIIRITVGSIESDSALNYFGIYRGFIPFNTSFLPDEANITYANVNVQRTGYVGADTDNDGYDYVAIVMNTSQANISALTTADYDTCGNTFTPYVVSNKIDVTEIGSGEWHVFTINSSYFGSISKTNYTLMGIREGHDIINHPIATNKSVITSFESAETGYLYINITYSEAAANTCSCPASAGNWRINGADNCNLTTPCYTPKGYNVSLENFTTGNYFNCNNTLNVGYLVLYDDANLILSSNCYINLSI